MLRSVKYGLYGALLAGLVAVPVVWRSVDKSVDLVVDGRTVAVHTTAATVGQLLSDKGYRVGPHDVVAPARTTGLQNGSRVLLQHGHLLRLSVDGVRRSVWTTEPTVNEAISALGYSPADEVSVSRSSRLPLGATSLAIRTPQVVTLVHDGKRQVVTTTAATVRSLLHQLGLKLGAHDRLSTLLTSPIPAGSVIRLQRVTQRTQFRTVSVPFATRKTDNSSMAAGLTKVVRAGRNGSTRVSYVLVYVDGKLAGRTRSGAVVLAGPRTQIVEVGTKQSVKPAGTPVAATPDPGSAMALAKTMLAARGWGDDQYDCLVEMWNHESGWRVNAANSSGAYGIPQALPGSKMASAGADWQTNPATQIKWGLGYIAARYSTPCGAWGFWQGHSYY